ncbi:MAG: hypothetical protein QNL62_20565, partial [Gammaproteobacteria bacterium]|nr:hypothetical protein [Gammaproteobacteria bacterium]
DPYAMTKVIVAEEVYGFDGEMFNQLKPKFSNDSIEHLNIKGGAIITQQNLYSMYMLTNHLDAFKMRPDENKLLAIRAPDDYIYGGSSDDDKMLKASHDFYSAYDDLRRTPEFVSAVHYYLANLNVTKFSHGVLPVKTKALYDMCNAAKADYATRVEELHAAGEEPFKKAIVNFETLRFILRADGYAFGNKGLAGVLQDLGFIKVRGEKTTKGARESTPRFWVSASEVVGLGPACLWDFYEKNHGK